MNITIENKTIEKQKEHEREELESMINFFSNKEYIISIEGTIDDYYKLEEKKAEYLDGTVLIQSTASLKHEEIFGDIFMKMRSFVMEKKLGRVLGSRFTIVLDNYRFEPDIVYISNENKGVLHCF